MMNWLKTLFGSFDRQQAAADRAAKAMEDIADGMEQIRDQFLSRLGVEAPAVAALPAKEDEPEPAGAKKRKAG